MRHLIIITICMLGFNAMAAKRFGDFKDPNNISVEELAKMAFNDKLSLEARWTATTRMGKFGDKARKYMERALKAPEWYMRNAALVTIHYSDRDWAVRKSGELLSDPSLVVRTAAVHSLRQLKAKEKEEMLWQKLSAKENFRGGQSLWVRHHIAEALGELADKSSQNRFAPLLAEKDPLVRQAAMKSLARITKLNFKSEHEWQSYLAQRGM